MDAAMREHMEAANRRMGDYEEMHTRMTGRLENVDTDKNGLKFAFVSCMLPPTSGPESPEENQRVFVHQDHLVGEGDSERMQDGATIEFNAHPNPKKFGQWQALNVII
eukprot:TRINITY_DN14689_c0_g1_i1.p1 TRINITY_DN14689_c0_g1~~TRINITY_DN14689_c0_g1_i1.p1  ORF type:complete len:108 (-),score=18.87 TRINITY_DN14689_c0_g1_i1:162-485(-)